MGGGSDSHKYDGGDVPWLGGGLDSHAHAKRSALPCQVEDACIGYTSMW